MQFTRVLFIIVFCSIYSLLGTILPAMGRDEIPKQRSETSEKLSKVNPTSRDKAFDGMIILYGTQKNANTSVPSPPLQKRSRSDNYFGTEQPQFSVTYTGFRDEAREAFQYAVDIWNSLIRSPVPIRIDATFTDFSGYENGKIILGGAYPAGWKSLRSLNLWFVDALADKTAGRDLEPSEPDIITRFNSHKDVNWYFGTDGNTPAGKMDFVSVVVHEIGHGLGFFTAARTEDSAIGAFSSFSTIRGKLKGGNPELPHIYDVFVVNGDGTAITEFRDPSTHLLEQFTSNDLFWSGAKGVAANGGGHPQLYAPSTWDRGSGYAHLDETLFPAGDVNSLMTPHLDKQEAIHDPGPIALGMLEDMGWSINKAPVFTEGSIITRTVPENTAAGVSIGSPIVATDANTEPLTYQLSGTDAASFDIDSASGQLKTKAALHHETKAAYTVTVTVSDGSLIDKIRVIITVVNIVVEVPTNNAPEFIDGDYTTRRVAENTPRGVNIREPIAATDADNDSLTYTLTGPDAASFHLDRTTGQLRTLAVLDYETKRTYTVKITVSDGKLTDSITVTVEVTDMDDQKRPTIALTSQPLKETTLNGSRVTLNLNNRVYENWINDAVTVTGVAGVTVEPFNVERKSDTQLAVQMTFDGTDFDTNATLAFSVKSDAIANYNGPALTATVPVTAVSESVNALSVAPLTEATLNGGMVTLTLNGGIYESSHTVGNNVTVSGITGVTVNRFDVTRVSDTQVNIKLMFDGTDFDTNADLIFKVGSDAVRGYKGTAIVAQLPVIAVVERIPKITAYAPRSLSEVTLNGSVVTLTLSSGVYAKSISNIRRALQVSGIAGVTLRGADVSRVSDTQVTVKLAFDGTNFDTDATLIFKIGAGAITAYDGPARIAEIPVTAVADERPTFTLLTPQPITEATLDGSVILLTLNNGVLQSDADIESAVTVSGIVGVTVKTSGVKRISNTELTVELAFDGNFDTGAPLTFTLGADAIAGYDGPALIAQILVTGGKESIVASTPIPLTEATLNESIITLTLNGAIYERSNFDLRGAVEVSGIDGVTFHWFDVDRVSDTALTVELTFKGNFDTDATLTFTLGADAIAGYDGPSLTTQLPVTGGKESVVATMAAPLTEAALHESVVTLTLSGGIYERSNFRIRGAVSVSGVAGVTVGTFGVDRVSDTKITVELEFNGDFDADATLIFTIGAEALLRYDGPNLIARVPVSGGKESVVATTKVPLTEATLNESIVTLTLSGGTYERSSFKIKNAISVSGIDGVTIGTFGVDRVSDTQVTVELTYAGNINTDKTLTFTIGPGAIANYNGSAFSVQVSVRASTESIVATTAAPLTEATLDESVVTLTLKGAQFERSIWKIRDAVTVSGIAGVTIPWHQPRRKNDTQLTVELAFDGTDFDTDARLTFTVGSDAIVGYNGPALTTQVTVTANVGNALLVNFPNPFNPETWIPYQLSKDAEVIITIYAVDGRGIRRLVLGHQPAGIYQSRSRAAYWDGRNEFGEPVASGVYFYTLTAGDFTATRRMLIRK